MDVCTLMYVTPVLRAAPKQILACEPEACTNCCASVQTSAEPEAPQGSCIGKPSTMSCFILAPSHGPLLNHYSGVHAS